MANRRFFRGSTIPNSKIEVTRKQKKLTELTSKHVHTTPPSHTDLKSDTIELLSQSSIYLKL